MFVKQGDILRAIMAENNVSVSELPRRLKVSRAAINNYSNTETFQQDVFDKLVSSLDVTPEYFLNYKYEQETKTIKKYSEEISVSEKKIRSVPIINRFAYASYSESWDDPEFYESIQSMLTPYLRIPCRSKWNDWKKDSRYARTFRFKNNC